MPGFVLPILNSLIGAGSSLFGNSLNNKAIERANQQSQQWQESMYNRQRQDSLADWTMQNDYNSPVSQMARLKQAGINPALYGTGGATTTAGPVRSSSPGSFTPRPKQFDLSGISNSIANYQDTRVREAQVNNLKTQNTVLAQDAILKAAKTITELATGKTKQFDLDLKNQLRQVAVDMAYATKEMVGVRRNLYETQQFYVTDKNKREEDLQPKRLELQVQELALKKAQQDATEKGIKLTQERINEVKERVKVLANTGQLQNLEIEMKRKGMTWNDPLIMRQLGTLLSNL